MAKISFVIKTADTPEQHHNILSNYLQVSFSYWGAFLPLSQGRDRPWNDEPVLDPEDVEPVDNAWNLGKQSGAQDTPVKTNK